MTITFTDEVLVLSEIGKTTVSDMNMNGGFIHNNLTLIIATSVALVAIGIWWWIRRQGE